MHSAARNGNFEIVELLVANRANINITNNYTSEVSSLDEAAMRGHTKIFKFLLKKGAKIDFLNRKQINSLHAASQKGHEEIIKLLLKYLLEQLEQRKITFDNLTNNVITASSIAKDNKQIKVQDLLEEFKNKVKLKAKAGPKAKIRYDNLLKKLLKIELADVIATPDLGNIEISSEQTKPTEEQIKEKVKQLNPQLDISQVKVQENSIADTAATIESIDQSVYPGKVTVTFTLTKKSSNPSKTQNASGNNDGGAGSNGNSDATNQGATGGNVGSDISSNVSVGEQPRTSGTQNQNTSGINHNNRYDVPADNSCLFWSAVTAYLLPVRNNNEEFRNRFIQLFGEENLKYLLHIQKLLQQYNLENNRDLNQLWYQDQTANNLVRVTFRNHVVDYIRDNLDRQTNLLLENQNQTFQDFINITETNEVDIDNYLIRMRQATTWGGTPEIVAMSNLINNNIRVDNDSLYQPVHQNANNNIQIFHVNGNHYNFALTPEEDRTNPAIVINDNQENVPVVDIIKRPDNFSPTTPTTEAKPIKLSVDDHAQHHTILANKHEDDDAHQGNIIANPPEPTITPQQKDEYHFFDKKTEDDSLKNDENLEINLIKNNQAASKQNVLAGNQPINTNMENLQTTTVEAINQYNALSKEEKLNEIKWN